MNTCRKCPPSARAYSSRVSIPLATPLATPLAIQLKLSLAVPLLLAGFISADRAALASEASNAIPALERVIRVPPRNDRAFPLLDPLRRPEQSIGEFAPRFAVGDQLALIAAARNKDIAVVRKLLAAGINPNGANERGDRPLSIALENQQIEIVRLLLLGGATADFRAASGQTPLAIAILKDNRSAVEILLTAGADPEQRSANRNTALNDAVILSRTAIALCLIEAGADLQAPDRLGRRVLAGAAAAGDVNILKGALAAGVDPDQPDRAWRLPIFWANNPDVYVDIKAVLDDARQARDQRRADESTKDDGRR